MKIKENKINEKDKDGDTILARICQYATIEIDIVKILISSGADVNVLNNQGNSALHLLSQKGGKNAAICAKLLLKKGAKPNFINNMGRTPLAESCFVLSKEKLKIIAILLEYGANPNYQTPKYKNTPLMMCINNGYWKYKKIAVEYLIDNGADINIENSEGQNVCGVLFSAKNGFRKKSQKFRDLLRYLIDNGVYVSDGMRERYPFISDMLLAKKNKEIEECMARIADLEDQFKYIPGNEKAKAAKNDFMEQLEKQN